MTLRRSSTAAAPAAGLSPVRRRTVIGSAASLLLGLGTSAWAQSGPNYPITGQQRSTAQQVASAEMHLGDEGCLSVPTIYDKVERHARVTVRALGRDGQPHEFEADGLLAVCVQHELDHLMGKVFVEYLSPLKRNRIRTKLTKRGREL